MSDFYGADLALVHDEGYGFLAREGAECLVRLLAEAGLRGGLVVDVACGTGIAAEILIGAGYAVHGIDVSPEMLAIARRRAPAAELVCGPLVDADLPPDCVAICSIGEGLCYAFDERAGRGGAARFFARAHEALRPDGVLMFDVVEPGRERPEPRRLWREGRDWLICVEASEQPGERVLRRRMAVFRREGDRWRRSDEEHVVHLYEREEVLADLTAAGFDARVLDGYAGERRFQRRGHAGFAAVKPRRRARSPA